MLERPKDRTSAANQWQFWILPYKGHALVADRATLLVSGVMIPSTQWSTAAKGDRLVRLEENSAFAAVFEALLIQASIVSTYTNT